MQFDWTAAIIGGFSMLVPGLIGYGILKEKTNKLQEALAELKRESHEEYKTFVRLQHFEAVVGPLRQTLNSVQVDIKTILQMIR